MSKTTTIETQMPLVVEDRSDDANGGRKPFDEAIAADQDVVIYRLSGAFFFGAAASIGGVLDRISDTYHVLILDFTAVPFLDSTAAMLIESLARKAVRGNIRVIVTGTTHNLREQLFAYGIKPPLVTYKTTAEKAYGLCKARRSSERWG